MSNTVNNTAATATIITGKRTRLSYANLFEPKGFDGQKPVYSASLIIPKDDKKYIHTRSGAPERVILYPDAEKQARTGNDPFPKASLQLS